MDFSNFNWSDYLGLFAAFLSAITFIPQVLQAYIQYNHDNDNYQNQKFDGLFHLLKEIKFLVTLTKRFTC